MGRIRDLNSRLSFGNHKSPHLSLERLVKIYKNITYNMILTWKNRGFYKRKPVGGSKV